MTASQPHAWLYCPKNNQSAENLRAVYGSYGADLIAYGHYHRNHVLSVDGKLLVNVASVGLRTDGLGLYTTVEYAAGHVSVVQQSVSYDSAEEDRPNRLESVPLLNSS